MTLFTPLKRIGRIDRSFVEARLLYKVAFRAQSYIFTVSSGPPHLSATMAFIGGKGHTALIYIPHILLFCAFGIMLGGIAAQQVRNFALPPPHPLERALTPYAPPFPSKNAAKP